MAESVLPPVPRHASSVELLVVLLVVLLVELLVVLLVEESSVVTPEEEEEQRGQHLGSHPVIGTTRINSIRMRKNIRRLLIDSGSNVGDSVQE